MTTKSELANKIGEAWKAHYAGQNSDALRQFQGLAEQYPDNIDALWGLGLAYRTAGQFEEAVQVFGKVQELVDAMLASDTTDYERFLMLKRMVVQQIEQVDKFLRS